ncbi:MAG: hypothetical protein JSR47_01160 [Proteobacteria bacterium]|nr:hypothetical protein [Pseudomonadota bacterium]MBS0546744.1 hypothetical protein [Pseudomonadota bacterium]
MSIRAIIGTVAVLAGFVVLEHSVDASTGQAGSCKATQAYSLLQPGDRLVVRAQPTPEAAVLGMLSADAASAGSPPAVVTMNASQSGWARIALATAPGYTAVDAGAPQSYGWIPADQLAVDSRVDGAITTYNRASLIGVATGTIENQDMKFRVLGCRGDLLQVINASQGNTWIDKWCARPEGCRG